jgi:hypothetical protein
LLAIKIIKAVKVNAWAQLVKDSLLSE